MSEWKSISTDPQDGRFRLYGLTVQDKFGHEWWEVHYVAFVDGELVTPSGDLFGDWRYEDFEQWADAPPWPRLAIAEAEKSGSGT